MLLEIPYGKKTISLDIPESHQVEVAVPGDEARTLDPDTLITRAIKNPIGRERLKNIVQPKDKVCIIVSDTTRSVPTAMMLRPLIQELLEASIDKKDIKIIFGLGIHRKQTIQEQMDILGQDIYSEFQCLDHDTQNCCFMGTTGRGTPVEIFEPAASADIIICTGNIEHHYFAGYTGGYKAVIPGVCSRGTIAANHALMIENGTAPGNLNSPVRKDLEEAGRLVGVDFILNVVLDKKRRVAGAVAGHPIEAHRTGAAMVDGMYKKVVEPADIVVVSPGGWPKDINLFQSHKSLEHVKSAVKPGGAIILAASCAEGLGNAVYEEWINTTSGPAEAIERLDKGFVQGGHKAALIGKLALEYRLFLVSDMEPSVVKKAYFKAVSGLQEAFDGAAFDEKARVLVVPYGGSILLSSK